MLALIFLRATARSDKRVLAIVILPVSVCPFVCHNPVPIQAQVKYINSRFLPRDSVESLDSCDQILSRWVIRFPSNKGVKEGYLLINLYFPATRLAW